MTMEKIGEPCAASKVVKDVQTGIEFAESIGIRLYFVRLIHLAEAAEESLTTEQNS